MKLVHGPVKQLLGSPEILNGKGTGVFIRFEAAPAGINE